MAIEALPLLLLTLDVVRPALTAPGFENFRVLFGGWVLTQGTHAVTEALVQGGVAGRRHHERFHRFFSRGTWSPDMMGLWVCRCIVGLLAEKAELAMVVDDTLAPKKGPQVFGIGSHIDAVRSTKRRKIFCFGHCWVTLAIVLPVPFSTRTWALPILFRLYRTTKDCERKGLPHRKKTELARELLDVVAAWNLGRRIRLSMDSAYCNDTVMRKLPECFTVSVRRTPSETG
jgi:SRSO17 transposase